MDKDRYFADLKAEDTALIVLNRADRWFNDLDTNGYLDKIRDMWAAYHGAYYAGFDDGHKITFMGEQDELTNMAVNHLRNIAQHILVMVTASRPSMQARAVNTDYKSLVQTKLANALLEYYMREKRLEKYINTAVEYAIVLGAGYVKMEWNATSGEIYDYIEDPGFDFDPENEEREYKGFPIYEGDVEFSNLSPFDVVFDSTKEGQDHDWVLCRTFKNKFDLAAKYPELKDRILALPTRDEKEGYKYDTLHYMETDDVYVYEFFHRRSESMPEGRYMLFLDHDIVLADTAMPYKDLPIYRISAGEILGTPYGYSPMFDLLPIQDAVNSLYSTILSNQTAFGVQNILLPRGTDINPSSVVGGLNIIEYNAQQGKPEPLNLTYTPKEVFEYMQMLVKDMETISGVSSVTRGNPEASLKSGNALALVQSTSLQYMSGLQRSYINLIEDIGTGLINMLKDYASVPRVAAIAGKRNRTEMKEFTGDDISKINRVIVDVGNPLAKTTAGRVQMAEQMLQMGLIKTPEQYLQVINTGRIEPMYEETTSELDLIRSENEKIIDGEYMQAVFTEQHSLHIKEHKSILSDPDLKKDPELVQRVADHIQQHIDLLRTTDPDILMMFGEQPLGPAGGSPANQPDPNQQVNTNNLDNSMANQVLEQPQVAAANPDPTLPQPATPPAPFQNAPTDPSDVPVG